MRNADSVASRTNAVENRFRDIVQYIEANEVTTTISSGDVTDVWDKFKLWAGNIGARQFPYSAASLESRLRGARRVYEQVVRLLDAIQEALDDLYEIVSGNQENHLLTLDPDLVNENPALALSWDGNGLGSSKLEKYEDQDLLEILSKSVGSLFKITVLVRKATPRDRFAKALQGKNPFMDDFDIAYVAERYPKLAEPRARWLCERLGRAITKRRQFLRYSREHSRRIAGHESAGPVVMQRARSPGERDGALSVAMARSASPSAASGLRSNSNSNYSGSYAAQTHASTKASTLNITELRRVEEMEAEGEETKSYVSAGSSFQLGNADPALHLPTLEEVSQGSDVFECPICFDIQTISKESSWRRHAFQDLRAYVCTGEGTCDSRLFGDSQSWLDHELQCHRQQWVCILCSKGPFRSQKMLENHLVQPHNGVEVAESQVSAFVSMGLRAVDAIPAADCPFCNEWAESLQSTTPLPDSAALEDVIITVDPKQYRRHVSHHMEQLALFALPRLIDKDHNDNASEKANLSRSTINQLVPSVNGEKRGLDDEWIPDPPLHIAAARGDVEEVKRLVNDGADVHLRGETWGSVMDAALSHPEASSSEILSFLRSILQLEDYVHTTIPEVLVISDMETQGDRGRPSKDPDDASGTIVSEEPNAPLSNLEAPESKQAGYLREPSLERAPPWVPTPRPQSTSRGVNETHHNIIPQIEISQEPLSLGQDTSGSSASYFDVHHHDAPRSGCLPRTGRPKWTSISGQLLTNDVQPDYYEYIRPADLVRQDLENPRRNGGHRQDSNRNKSLANVATAQDAAELLSTTRKAPEKLSVTVENTIEKLASPTSEYKVKTQLPSTGEDKDAMPKHTELPLKGILKRPTSEFPEPLVLAKEGISAPKKTSASPGACWTKISRTVIDPSVLAAGAEQYEERDVFLVVLRLLSKGEIDAYVMATERLRIGRRALTEQPGVGAGELPLRTQPRGDVGGDE